MVKRFRVDRDHVGPRITENIDPPIGVFDLEVHIERESSDPSDRVDHQGSKGQVLHIVPVHHVEVKLFRSGAFEADDLFS
jgi:hypothetical protein